MGTLFFKLLKQEVNTFIQKIIKKHKNTNWVNNKLFKAKDKELQELQKQLLNLRPQDDLNKMLEDLDDLVGSVKEKTTKLAADEKTREGTTEPSLDNLRILVRDIYRFFKQNRLLEIQDKDITSSNPQIIFKSFFALYFCTHYRQRLEQRLNIGNADPFPQLRQEKENIFISNLSECLKSINRIKEDLNDRDNIIKTEVLSKVDTTISKLLEACNKATVGVKTTVLDMFVFKSKVGPSYTPGAGFMHECLIATKIMIENDDLTIEKALKVAQKMKDKNLIYEEASKDISRSNTIVNQSNN